MAAVVVVVGGWLMVAVFIGWLLLELLGWAREERARAREVGVRMSVEELRARSMRVHPSVDRGDG